MRLLASYCLAISAMLAVFLWHRWTHPTITVTVVTAPTLCHPQPFSGTATNCTVHQEPLADTRDIRSILRQVDQSLTVDFTGQLNNNDYRKHINDIVAELQTKETKAERGRKERGGGEGERNSNSFTLEAEDEHLSVNKPPPLLIVVGWSVTRGFMGTLFAPQHDTRVPCLDCANSAARCLFTNNRSLARDAAAILFHASRLTLTDLPTERQPMQKWIFYTMESPYHHRRRKVDLSRFNNAFNLTVTYSSASNIQTTYGTCAQKPAHSSSIMKTGDDSQQQQLTRSVLRQKKSKMAAWFVSNCNTAGNRELYVRLLRQYIPVDIYGRCGKLRCASSNEDQCYRMLEKTYLFYLAFENSICADYVTEKVYNILIKRVDVIPVVYGGADYASILPPHSFISAAAFHSPEELSTYLIYLSKNGTAYDEYFAWRESYVCMKAYWPPALCQYLYENIDKTTIVDNLNTFWSPEARCTQDLPSF